MKSQVTFAFRFQAVQVSERVPQSHHNCFNTQSCSRAEWLALVAIQANLARYVCKFVEQGILYFETWESKDEMTGSSN